MLLVSLLFLWPIQKSQFFVALSHERIFIVIFFFVLFWEKDYENDYTNWNDQVVDHFGVASVARGLLPVIHCLLSSIHLSLSFSFLLLFLFSSLILPVYLWSFFTVYCCLLFVWLCICVREFVSVSLFQNTGKF